MCRFRRQFLTVVMCFLSCVPSVTGLEDSPKIPISVTDLGKRYELLGLTHQPIGKMITVEGQVVSRWYGKRQEPTLRVQRIEHKPTQEDIQIRLRPVNGGYDDYSMAGVKTLKTGQTYKFAGYEAGEFAGLPSRAYDGGRVPFSIEDFNFRNEFVVVKATPVDQIQYSPAEFTDKFAVMQGTAVSDQHESWIKGSNWRILVNRSAPWPDWMEGKFAEVYGLVRRMKQSDSYEMESPESRLVDLNDQVGHRVSLRGNARTAYDSWWLDYRDQRVFVDKMNRLPGWSPENAGKSVVITGQLIRAKVAVLADTEKDKDHFLVENASWSPSRELLYPEVSDWSFWTGP